MNETESIILKKYYNYVAKELRQKLNNDNAKELNKILTEKMITFKRLLLSKKINNSLYSFLKDENFTVDFNNDEIILIIKI